MAFTGNDVRDLARDTLTDDGTSWPDAEVLRAVNAALAILRNKRPDLFFGHGWSASVALAALTDAVPLDDQFQPALADYLIGRLSAKQADELSTAISGMFLQLAGGQV